jgi:putative cell wall-binding protein/alpha-tubulin suppressor-like RCC1 family protein
VSAGTVNGTNATPHLAGQNRYQTSVVIAEAYNNNGECDNVILASGNSFPDALTASILSKKLNAPILLVDTTVNASSEAFNYIGAQVSNTGTVYIVGGTGVIGPDFETKLASMGYSNIKRLDGADRYDTNMLIVNDVNVPQGTPVFIASGENFPDALSISSYSGSKQYPTLLVGVDYLPEKTIDYLLSEKPSDVYIAGGTSVVSQDLESQINALVPGAAVTRLAGNDRYGTNAAVLNEFSPSPETIYLASGDDFPDALAGSALAAKTGNSIILVDDQLSTIPPAVEDYLKKLSSSGIQPKVIALGGTEVVSDILCQQVNKAFNGKPQIVYSENALGGGTAYYLDSNGQVWAWGDGTYGELGNGTRGTLLNPSTSSSLNYIYGSCVPVQVSKLTNIVSITAGGSTCYALDSSGRVWAWGFGSNGELGDGTENSSNTPVQVTNLTDIVSIAAGDSTGYALDSSGHVWTWGAGLYGQLGIPDVPMTSAVPSQITNLTDIISIAAEGYEAYAFDSSGHVWVWGKFDGGTTFGAIDTQKVVSSTTGTQTTAIRVGSDYSTVPVQLTNLRNIISIAGGKGKTRYALDSSGKVWAWEFSGNLVNGTTSEVQTTPVQVLNLSNIVEIVGNGANSYEAIDEFGFALDSSGHVLNWGGVYSDGVGRGPSTTPVPISNVPNYSKISNIIVITGEMYNGYAIDSSGNVWAWGQNNNGQLGNGTITDSNGPVQVLGLSK